MAACLGALFVVCIVIEAFDADLALWPFGTEYFTVAWAGQLACGVPVSRSVSALLVTYGFVMTAGAYLVLRYRARSALATDNSSMTLAFTLAEPWGLHSDWRPGARLLFLVK